MREEVSKIRERPVFFNSFDCKFTVRIPRGESGKDTLFVAPSLKGLVRKVNDFFKVEWKEALFVPYSPWWTEVGDKLRKVKVRLKGNRLYAHNEETGKWIPLDKYNTYAFDADAFKRLQELKQQYDKIVDEWTRISHNLKHLVHKDLDGKLKEVA